MPERLTLADKQDMPLDDLLLMILTDEIARRDNAAADNRATEAELDPSMRLELWDKTAKVSFDKKVLSELVIGIFALDDVLEMLADDLRSVVALVGKQRKVEESRRP
jgi:hypothetical protein